jgi:hypothetical protein
MNHFMLELDATYAAGQAEGFDDGFVERLQVALTADDRVAAASCSLNTRTRDFGVAFDVAADTAAEAMSIGQQVFDDAVHAAGVHLETPTPSRAVAELHTV